MKFRPSYRKSAYTKYKEAHPTTCYVGASLTNAQRYIADKITLGMERYYTWCAGRQVGKSFTAVQILLWFAINKRDTVSMYVSMTYNQTLKLFNELYRGIKSSGIISSYSKSNFEIEFKNGSRILFRSYQNPDNSRGYHISGILIIDEAAFMSDGDFESIYMPMLQNHKTAKALLISSPRGCNWFHEYYLRGCRRHSKGLLNKSYLSFKTTYKDNPFCDLDEIENYRLTMPEPIFKQEILAEFVSSANSAFGDRYKQCIRQSISNIRKYGERYFIGVDVAKRSDYTTAIVINQITGEVVEILRMNHKEYHSIADDIVKLAVKWNPSAILQEINGVGDPFNEILERKLADRHINCLVPWLTTNQSKKNAIEALNIAFEEKSIFIPDDIDLTDELDSFEVQYSQKSHSVIYGARSGHHDDLVMGLALANWAKRTNTQAGQYAVC